MPRTTHRPARAPSCEQPPGTILDEAAAQGWVPRTCFRTGPPGVVGVELEHLLVTTGRVPAPVPGDLHRAVTDDLADAGLTSAVTVEPGGQLELSGPPARTLVAALGAMADDVRVLHRCAAEHGVRPVGVGLDPWHARRRMLRTPRYDAMEAYFDRSDDAGRAGRLMMAGTASVQVNLQAGAGPDDPDDVLARRWDLLHAVGPALVAAFANSPLSAGRPTGWASTRQSVWATLDAVRTREPGPLPGTDLAARYTRWALDAPLMLVRRDGPDWSAPRGVTFRDWLRHGVRVVPDRSGPTTDDLATHLSTLFPPVRARGHLEVRYLDALPDDWWQVPVAVLGTLVDDPAAADAALASTDGVRGRWVGAARDGVADDELRRAAVQILDDVARRLSARPDTRPVGGLVGDYLERWTLRGRAPADDLLDALGGSTRSAVRSAGPVGGAR